MRALFLSAGFGTRLRPLTEVLAKPAIPFLNVPMLGYPMHLAQSAGVEQAVVNLHHLPETVMKAAKALNTDLEISFVTEQPSILDSGGSIKNVQSFLDRDENFWVFNGDTVCLFDSLEVLQRMKTQHIGKDAIVTILVCPFPKVSKSLGGVFVKHDLKTIDHFSKTNTGTGLTAFHYIGVCLFNKAIFEFLPECPSNILYDGVTAAMAAGHKAEVVIADQAQWFETGNQSDFLHATSSCLRCLSENGNAHRAHLEAVLNQFTPEWQTGFEVTKEFTVLRETEHALPYDVAVEGFAVVGRNVSIAEYVSIENSVILPDSVISSGTKLINDIAYDKG